jgi:hypothetical protein
MSVMAQEKQLAIPTPLHRLQLVLGILSAFPVERLFIVVLFVLPVAMTGAFSTVHKSVIPRRKVV